MDRCEDCRQPGEFSSRWTTCALTRYRQACTRGESGANECPAARIHEEKSGRIGAIRGTFRLDFVYEYPKLSLGLMSKQKPRFNRSAPQVATPFEEARDEMFQHIMKRV